MLNLLHLVFELSVKLNIVVLAFCTKIVVVAVESLTAPLLATLCVII